MTNNEIFAYEEKRLKEVIAKLNEQIKSNEKKFSEQEHFIIGFKEGMRGTQFNRQALMSMYATQITELKSAIDNPYFGRFEFVDDSHHENKTIYIGKKSIIDEDHNAIAYDWRSAICSMYYDYNIGPAEYTINGQTEKGKITSKRQIIIKNGKLDSVSEQDTISDDTILLKYLNESADSRLKSIIATIQREQNAIIRSPIENNYITSGVAGSGKTTVALHRIAYLLYNEARNVNESDFMILGPNKYFLNYISALLPDLDIRNVSSSTYDEIALTSLKTKFKLESRAKTLDSVLKNKSDLQVLNYKGTISYLKLIEKFIEAYVISHIQEDIVYEGITLCKSERLRGLISNKSLNGNYGDWISSIIKNITKEIKDNSADLSHEVWSRYRTEYLSLPKDNPRRKEIIDITDAINGEFKKGCPNVIKEYFKFAKINPLHLYIAFVENIDKMTDDDVAKRLQAATLPKLKKKQVESSDLAALLLINYLMNGNKEYERYEHLVIDEAQDLSLGDFYILKKLFPKATFDIYGDLNQAIYDYSSDYDWETLNNQIFDGKAILLALNKSYRTTEEIADTSNLILDSINRKISECVARSGEPIITKSIDGCDEIKEILNDIEELLAKKYETIAIICKDEMETKNLYGALSKLGLNINLITDQNEEYNGGVSILPTYLSKGLEFDAVILTDANCKNYQDNLTDQKLLYVAITRAMHELRINYTGEITNSLASLTREECKIRKLTR